MKYTQSRQENTLTVTFKTPVGDWAKYDMRAYEQNKGKYSVPGFRKGHVPKVVLEQRYGKGLFFEDALYLAAQEYYVEFLDKNKEVQPVARPAIDEKSVKIDDKNITFAVKVTVRPQFELGQYKGLKIDKTPVRAVEDADVDKELQRVRDQHARFIEVTDRAVADGDRITLDYCGKVDGVAFEGGTATDQTLDIGSHTFIEGFEEQLVGLKINETRDINVTFPQEYHAAELAGKAAVFTVTVKSINRKELPEVDDEFAKDVSEFDTLDDYKKSIRQQFTDEFTKQAENEDERKLIDKIVEGTTINIPAEMVEEQIDRMIEDLKYRWGYRNIDLDDYLAQTQTKMEDLRNMQRPAAEKTVRTTLVMEEIVKAEKIVADQSEVDAKIREYAERIGSTFEEVSKQFTAEDRAYFENQSVTDKLFDLLKKVNTIA